MRLSGVDVSSWSNAKEKLLRHMFILDLIRDFNKFAYETAVKWDLSPVRDQETLDNLRGTMDKYKKNTLYTIFTEEEEERYKEDIVDTDEAILARVGNMSI